MNVQVIFNFYPVLSTVPRIWKYLTKVAIIIVIVFTEVVIIINKPILSLEKNYVPIDHFF